MLTLVASAPEPLSRSAASHRLQLFSLLLTRRPDSYIALTAQLDATRPYGAGHEATAVVR